MESKKREQYRRKIEELIEGGKNKHSRSSNNSSSNNHASTSTSTSTYTCTSTFTPNIESCSTSTNNSSNIVINRWLPSSTSIEGICKYLEVNKMNLN